MKNVDKIVANNFPIFDFDIIKLKIEIKLRRVINLVAVICSAKTNDKNPPPNPKIHCPIGDVIKNIKQTIVTIFFILFVFVSI